MCLFSNWISPIFIQEGVELILLCPWSRGEVCCWLLAVGWKRVIIRVNTGRWWLVWRERERVISQQVVTSHTCYSTRCENQCRVPLVAWGPLLRDTNSSVLSKYSNISAPLQANNIIVYVNMSLLPTSAHSRYNHFEIIHWTPPPPSPPSRSS